VIPGGESVFTPATPAVPYVVVVRTLIRALGAWSNPSFMGRFFRSAEAQRIIGATPGINPAATVIPAPLPGSQPFPGGPTVPDRLPPYVPPGNVPRVPPRIALPSIAGFLTTGVGLLIAAGMLWPRSAGRGSDLRDYDFAVPAPAAPPGRRPRRRRGRVLPPPGIPGSIPRPAAVPRPRTSSGPVTISAPRTSSPPAIAVPGQLPAPRTIPSPAPVPRTQPAPTVMPTVVPAQLPSYYPATIPAPRTLPPATTAPRIPAWAYVVPFLPLRSPSLSPVASPSPLPLTQLQADPLASVRPMPLAVPQTDACAQQRARERRRRKQACKNPVVSRTIRRKGSVRYSIVTRKLVCPASSRKKPQLQLVR
jgi:hypothetical protein